EAHVALGGVLAIHDWDWAGSETEFARAMELDPDGAPAYQCYSVACLIPQGRLQEALEAAQQACELDPLSPSVNSSLALAHFVLGEYNEAIDYFKKALEIDQIGRASCRERGHGRAGGVAAKHRRDNRCGDQ